VTRMRARESAVGARFVSVDDIAAGRSFRGPGIHAWMDRFSQNSSAEIRAASRKVVSIGQILIAVF
jgi:hypothetical protein